MTNRVQKISEYGKSCVQLIFNHQSLNVGNLITMHSMYVLDTCYTTHLAVVLWLKYIGHNTLN